MWPLLVTQLRGLAVSENNWTPCTEPPPHKAFVLGRCRGTNGKAVVRPMRFYKGFGFQFAGVWVDPKAYEYKVDSYWKKDD